MAMDVAESNKALATEIMAWKEEMDEHKQAAKACKLEIEKLEKRLYSRLLNPNQAELELHDERPSRVPRT